MDGTGADAGIVFNQYMPGNRGIGDDDVITEDAIVPNFAMSKEMIV